jgi:predicted nucleic acid-binding protein
MLATTRPVRCSSRSASVVTVRKTIDVMIATYCILHGLELLHADRDFDAMEQHLGLQVCRSA